MADVILRASDRFPVGTSVAAYPASNWPATQRPPSGAPVGSSSQTATVAADGTLTFTALADGAEYYAYALVSGEHRYVRVFGPQSGNPRLGGTKISEADVAADNLDGLTTKPSLRTLGTGARQAAAGSSLASLDRDLKWPGVIAPMVPQSWQQGVVLTAGRAYIARFVPSRNMTVDRIAFAVTAASTTDDPCDVGLYNASLGRIVSKGATLGLLNTVGVKEATFAATALTAGTVYFAAFSSDTAALPAAPASVMMSTTGYAHRLFGDGAGVRAQEFMAAHPLPATFTQNGSISNVPVLAVRES